MKITENWDISHICIAVSDLEQAMETFGTAFGVDWSVVVDQNTPLAAPLYPDEKIAQTGLRQVWSRTEPALELAHAAPGSPAERIWGVPDGTQKVHHICYWVDDIQAASRQLAETGFDLEVTVAPGDVVDVFAYHRNAEGTRIELMRAQDKPAISNWLKTGVLNIHADR